MALLKRIIKKINDYLRYFINARNKQRLIHKNPTIMSSNCTGGFISNDLNLRFNSPFVNLYLTPKDFIRYLKNIPFYQAQSLHFIKTEKNYPVAQLADLHLYFVHYPNEQIAEQKWQERSQRMNIEHLYIIMTDRDGCTYEDMVEFDQLPFQNKVIFTHKHYPEIKSSFTISGFEHQIMVGDLFDYTGFFGKRYYDQFDYVKWLNRQ